MASDTEDGATGQQSIAGKKMAKPYDVDDVFADQWYMPTPPMIPLADLRKPSMVTVHISDNGTKDSFTFNKGSLCARSAYFQRAFNGRFLESDKGEVALEDDGIATTRIMNIFTTWISSGRLYEEDGVATDSARMEFGSFGRAGQGGSDTEPAAKRIKLSAESEIEARRLAFMQRGGPPKGSVYEPAYRPALPLTWHWSLLFAIYVFADKYDTADLRCAAMNSIQAKLLMITPMMFSGPTLTETRYAVEHLPSVSLLRRLLVDFWATTTMASFMREVYGGEIIAALSDMPSSFLAECLMAAKTFDEAVAFDDVPEGHIDALRTYDKADCHYHEHQNDSQLVKDRCALGWIRFRDDYCIMPEKQAQGEDE
ncbi:hypothetical protein HII31_11986 [Pseudocercospora fuligena]|uniref:BTB domain-containing protein n=1 Tax=Pseudocercospora fuligena TaxID=685502 RepID=A0A8H6R994_9PEZI|nr:hypothetical protein HII31_11986 [Pseudocercospora fuligena]